MIYAGVCQRVGATGPGQAPASVFWSKPRVIRYPHSIDRSQYAPHVSNPDVKYGLPQEVAFCTRCVISNQRPNSAVEYRHTRQTKKDTINFDDE